MYCLNIWKSSVKKTPDFTDLQNRLRLCTVLVLYHRYLYLHVNLEYWYWYMYLWSWFSGLHEVMGKSAGMEHVFPSPSSFLRFLSVSFLSWVILSPNPAKGSGECPKWSDFHLLVHYEVKITHPVIALLGSFQSDGHVYIICHYSRFLPREHMRGRSCES